MTYMCIFKFYIQLHMLENTVHAANSIVMTKRGAIVPLYDDDDDDDDDYDYIQLAFEQKPPGWNLCYSE
ncbi:hypothetical protein C0J52_14534 [Blattella germanica]|nr:hypothetical protein C0J52_14534 [Blattella germanica]